MRGLTEHACRSCGTVAQLLDPVANWECIDCWSDHHSEEIQRADEDEHYVCETMAWAAAIADDFALEKAAAAVADLQTSLDEVV